MSETIVEEPKDGKNRFGTFAGVFTPSILTILGVIMFMRANYVVGEAGIMGAVIILLIAKSITFLTSLSIGAISTNMQVRGGGAYYMISRVLGPEFGGAIGLALFSALSLSVPFYILGFTEALVKSFPQLTPYFQHISLGSAAILFIVAYVGAGWALKIQFLIMAVLFASIVAFMGGAAQLFTLERFSENWGALDLGSETLKSLSPEALAKISKLGFWIVFAIYFPAVTGIDAGVNMSGDLRDPGKSIPRGTLCAVGVGFIIYLGQILLCGGAFDRTEMLLYPYRTLATNALFGLGFLVTAGVFAATLSSALGSYMAAPRVLQAVSRDSIIRYFRPFGKGTAKGDEPRRALVFVGVITLAVLLWAGDETEGGALNAVAAIVTMFFLFSYGTINIAAGLEAWGGNPSFRPKFKFFHWSAALLGAGGCIASALLINPEAAVGAGALVAALVWYVRRQHLRSTFGDARRGFIYSNVRNNLLRLSTMKEDSRNWRPTILVLSGNPATREPLVTYAVWLESGRGIVFLANVLTGSLEDKAQLRLSAIKQLENFCAEQDIQAFPLALVAEDLSRGVSALLQTASAGPIKPNLAMFGWSENLENVPLYCRQIRNALAVGMSVVLLQDRGLPDEKAGKRIDVWWRGHKNGGLMMLLAHLLTENWEWAGCEVRVLRVIDKEAGRTPAMEALQQVLDFARLDATVQVIVSDRKFHDLLHSHSGDADCVILGFENPDTDHEVAWHDAYNAMLAEMPTSILVCSRSGEDLLA